jgi:HD-GYP domain-containing protein (c-di-GMP phosphodiesterase class II)
MSLPAFALPEEVVERSPSHDQRRTETAAVVLLRRLARHDPATADHCRRVQFWSLRLAASLGLDGRQCWALRIAAGLHDLGKLDVPQRILRKPGALTPEEYGRVQQHPVDGETRLRSWCRDEEVLAAVRGHHEQFDGRGYPDGLSGTAIPLLARIVAVADAFDALSQPRPYRNALPVNHALGILEDGAASHFDPELVEVFVELVRATPVFLAPHGCEDHPRVATVYGGACLGVLLPQ